MSFMYNKNWFESQISKLSKLVDETGKPINIATTYHRNNQLRHNLPNHKQFISITSIWNDHKQKSQYLVMVYTPKRVLHVKIFENRCNRVYECTFPWVGRKTGSIWNPLGIFSSWHSCWRTVERPRWRLGEGMMEAAAELPLRHPFNRIRKPVEETALSRALRSDAMSTRVRTRGRTTCVPPSPILVSPCVCTRDRATPPRLASFPLPLPATGRV